MISLTDQQLHDFQGAVQWKTGMLLPDGRVLGVPGKRGGITQRIDFRVAEVARRMDPATKTILEVGCCEGIHTVQLAQICRRVVALEVRPKNIVATLTRLFVHGVENAKVVLADVRDLDSSFGSFDVVFHVGVLYHLMQPVEHVHRLSRLADTLLLDTHYCRDDTKFRRSDEQFDGKDYRAFLYTGEGGWADMFSGVENTSRWLHQQALLDAVRDAGYDALEIISDRIERNGPRMTLLARRTSPILGFSGPGSQSRL